MTIRGDIAAQAVLRLVTENEALRMQVEYLTQENEQLKAEREQRQAASTGPRAVPSPEEETPA